MGKLSAPARTRGGKKRKYRKNRQDDPGSGNDGDSLFDKIDWQILRGKAKRADLAELRAKLYLRLIDALDSLEVEGLRSLKIVRRLRATFLEAIEHEHKSSKFKHLPIEDYIPIVRGDAKPPEERRLQSGAGAMHTSQVKPEKGG
jgi:hypothetical protein